MRFYSENLGLTESAFTILRDLIHERTGIFFSNDKKDILSDKLSERVIELNFSSFVDYYYLLKYDDNAAQEWDVLMTLITVNETYFWRELDQINELVNKILPAYHQQFPEIPIRIWCAASSSGEEPISIAIAINEAGLFDKIPIDIYATDVSSEMIQKARIGHFRERSFRSLPDNLKQQYFTDIGNKWRLHPEIHNRIKWGIVNLMNDEIVSTYATAPFIFCRNVLIYFNDKSIKKLTDMLYRSMPKEAYLFLGVSESLLRINTKFRFAEVGNAYVYRKY